VATPAPPTRRARLPAIPGGRYRRTVKLRLILLSLAGALAMIATLAIVLYLTQQRIQEQAEQDAVLLARVIASEYRTRIHALQQVLNLLAQWPAAPDDPAAPCAALSGLTDPRPVAAVFGLVSSTGAALCDGGPLNARLDATDRAFLARLGTAGGAYRLTGTAPQPRLLVVHPVTGRSDAARHFVVAVATLDWSGILPGGDGSGAEPAVVLAARDGGILASYPAGFAVAEENLADTAFWDSLRRHGAASGIVTRRDGEEKIAGFAVVRDDASPLFIGVFLNRSPLWHNTFTTLLENLILVTGALVAVFLLILYSHYRIILRYLSSLVGTARRMAAGDFSVRAEWAEDPSEFGSLARAFNTLAENLATREKKLREQAAQLERSNIELEQFAYVASHDLKEPLRMVASFCGLLQQRYAAQLDAKAQQYIHYAVDGAQRMQTLIGDLLTLARVGSQSAPFAPVDCQTLLQQVVSDLRHIIRKNQAQISYAGLPCVQADETQLAQLFRNLLGNALKFHGPAPPRIRIEAFPDTDGWVFAVHDNGIGIAPEFLDRIFLIFQRLHQRDHYPGNGIGLAVCKKIVERHGGRIWVESTVGGGSTFYFSLPQPSTFDDEASGHRFSTAAGRPPAKN
jgi:signal transduction histidine kinase